MKNLGVVRNFSRIMWKTLTGLGNSYLGVEFFDEKPERCGEFFTNYVENSYRFEEFLLGC
ncbi:hypothetical protein CWO92_13295 [Heyndrickxia camelliae]|uniref:Uncharacterized protein n=1 Tax=Heyndrickxia camelliae TaxID=1707093 RepID=A0A2N3LJ73_9BACI|nr:hypothetical protein CWO92_13290 [Heyndrickxia camelliae]PKR84679.1 hypothetical protein CWO92_13295 [Heyndrickxia camelliae]